MELFNKLLMVMFVAEISVIQANAIGILEVRNLDISTTDSKLYVEMTLDASNISMKGDREVLYTPMLVNGSDTLRMPSFTIAGRNRYYNHLRNDRSGSPELYRAGEIYQPIVYKFDTPCREWMETAQLEIAAKETGCCKVQEKAALVPLARIDLTPKTFIPEYAYVLPKAEAVKMRKISARAYIDFPVNMTEIYPDYRRNPSELAKIRATIDSVRNDKNLTITSIHIKGFASPEGSYANNVKLAKGRTATLAGYVNGLYHFPPSTITTSYQPEDWEGLREYVASPEGAARLMNAEAILSLIGNPEYKGDDDRREWMLKKNYPEDYAYLLEEIYPGLRHSDYDVNYTIRSYTDPQDIIQTMRTAPQNLSLQELFVAAQSQEPGSAIYNEAFEIAVRMYPDDPVANLNAACSALQRDDLASAGRYLEKAGNSTEAQYARALLTAKQGNKEAAVEMLSRLPMLPQASDAVNRLKSIGSSEGQIFTTVETSIELK